MSSTTSPASLSSSSSHHRSYSTSSSASPTRASARAHTEGATPGQQSPAPSSVSTSGSTSPLPGDGEPPHAPSQWQILCLCLPAAAVQVGWTVGESLLIPYLLSLGVSNTVANFAWLINPVFGLFLQPVLGHASDSCTSAMGRRRPFLFLFHLGSVCGLLTVVFAADVLHLLGYPAYSEGGASTVLVGLIFLGFATADMCHDLMLMPARALLNDQLPDEQIDQGNSSFALISSLGAIIGLSMVIAPLDDLWPLSLLFIPIRATFVVAAALVMTSNVISFFIARNIDTPLSEIKLRQAKEEEEARAAQRAKLDPHSPHSGAGHPERTAEPAASPSPPPAPKGGEGELLTLSSILFVYSVVPRPLVVIWLCQFFFWYCVLHVNIWTSSYVAISLYHAEKGEEFDHGVRQATIGLLIQAIVAFVASSLMTRANAAFGITNYYHASALLYAGAVSALFLFPSYVTFLVVMTLTGLALPAIYSSPFVLIEVHAADDDSDDEDEDEDDDEDTAAEGEREREEHERRKEHRQLDLASPRHKTQPHTPSSVPHAAATPSSVQSASPTFGRIPRVTKRVNLSLPSSHRSTPEPSPHSGGWSEPSKETDALLPARRRPTPFSKEENEGRVSEGDEGEADDGPVYDMEFLDEWRGVLTGVYNVTMILAQIIVGLTSGLMIDWWGDIRIVFLWSAVLCFAVHSIVVLFGLSKPKEETQEEVEEEETEEERAGLLQREAEERRASTASTAARRPPPLMRLSTVQPEMPPLIDYRSFSTRALPGRLRSYVPHTPARPRHLRHLTHHQLPINGAASLSSAAAIEDPPALHRSRSAPALVLLSRPKGVVKGVPVFQAAAAAGRTVSHDRMKLERLRERTRLFSHLPSPSIRRRHDRLRASNRQEGRPQHPIAFQAMLEEEEKAEQLEHERALWYSGAEAHVMAAQRHDEALADRQEGVDGCCDDPEHRPYAAGHDGGDSGGATSVPLSTSAAESSARFTFTDQQRHAFTFDTDVSNHLSYPSTAEGLPLSAPPVHPFRGSFSLTNLYEVRAGTDSRRRIEETVMEVEDEEAEDEEDQPQHRPTQQSSDTSRRHSES